MQVKNHPIKAQPPDQTGSVILAKEPTVKVCLPSGLFLNQCALVFSLDFTDQNFLTCLCVHSGALRSWHTARKLFPFYCVNRGIKLAYKHIGTWLNIIFSQCFVIMGQQNSPTCTRRNTCPQKLACFKSLLRQSLILLDRQILPELLPHLARHKPRRLLASFQILKGIGVQSLEPVARSQPSTSLFWVKRQ